MKRIKGWGTHLQQKVFHRAQQKRKERGRTESLAGRAASYLFWLRTKLTSPVDLLQARRRASLFKFQRTIQCTISFR